MSVYVAFSRSIPVAKIAAELTARKVESVVITDLTGDNKVRMAASVVGVPIAQTVATPWQDLEGVKEANTGTRQDGTKYNKFAHLKAVQLAVAAADSVLAIVGENDQYAPQGAQEAFRLHKPVDTVIHVEQAVAF